MEKELKSVITPEGEPKQEWNIDTCRYWDMEIGCEREKCICENTPLKEELKQEGMYSEEEALNLLIECSKWLLPQTDEDLYKIKQWFDKVKKK